MSIENPTNFLPENKLPPIIQKVAAIYGIPIDSDTFRDLVIISSACGIADNEFDRCGDPIQRKQIYLNSLNYLFGASAELDDTGSITFPAFAESMGYLKELISTIPYDRQQRLRSNLRAWNRLSEHRRSDASPYHSVDVRLSDLDLTALIYLSAVPEEAKDGNWDEFLFCMRKMIRTAGMIDDFFDLEEDYGASIIGIEPKLSTKMLLIAHSLREGLSVLNPQIFKHLFLDSVLIMCREFLRRRFDCTDQYKFNSSK